jgi:hypothetical protein
MSGPLLPGLSRFSPPVKLEKSYICDKIPLYSSPDLQYEN